MYSDEIALGAAVPPNWTLGAAGSAGVLASASGTPTTARAAVDLVQAGQFGNLVAALNWPVRDQHDRGSCAAFAVVAAEELYRSQATGAPEPLSEEHFYAAMRSVDPINGAGVNVSPAQVAENETDGSTYLAQAREALIQHGLCAAALMPYEAEQDVAYYVQNIPGPTAQNAIQRQVPQAELVHNIIDIAKGGLPPHQTTWVTPLQSPLADIFWLQLSQNIPVVASFAVMDLADWFEDIGMDWGEVRYEGDQGPTPVGGHTVCLTGYVPPVVGDTVTGGWFQFRNSLGRRFAYEYDRDPHAPVAIAQGYGHISAADVNLYCWEYLYRASPP